MKLSNNLIGNAKFVKPSIEQYLTLAIIFSKERQYILNIKTFTFNRL